MAADIVCDEEIAYVNVLGVLGARALTVGFKKDTTLVVLIDNVVLDVVSLGCEEQTRPEDETDGIIDANQFRFSGAACIEFLFGGHGIDTAMTQGHGGPSMTAHVGMHRVGGIHPPLDDTIRGSF